MFLVGDVGATKTALSYFDPSSKPHQLIDFAVYSTRIYPCIDDIILDFVEKHPRRVNAVGLALAGPIRDEECKITNVGWAIQAERVKRLVSTSHVLLSNDVEALAYSVPFLGPASFIGLRTGSRQVDAPIVVVAAGTGFGVAALLKHREQHVVLASEGGHADFAPRSELEIEFLKFLLRDRQRVSYDNVISGPGLLAAYSFFMESSGHSPNHDVVTAISAGNGPAAISQAATSGVCPIARMAVDLFVALYGAHAGNLALTFSAQGGVVIGGGIAPKIIDNLRQPSFLQAFEAKGPLAHVLREIPVQVVIDQRAALFGAGWLLTRRLSSATTS